MLSVTPLLGVSSSSPHAYLLRCDDYNLLLDCGWSSSFDTAQLDALQPLLADVDCVLLSHSGFRHVGSLAYLRRRCGLRCPVYCTLPVQSMGAMTMYDVYQQEVAGWRRRVDDGSEEELFTLDDVDAAFDAMIPLKYSEERPLPPKLAGSGGGGVGEGQGRLRISPHQSGHSVGGAVWRILRESDVLLYAVDYNHGKERHLDGGVLEAFTRPALLLLDTAALHQHPAFDQAGGSGRKAREARLREELRRTLSAGGVALLPCDSSGRVLELLLFLYLDDDVRRMQAPLIFASPQADATVDFAAQSIEWLSTACNNLVHTTHTNPFSMEQLHRLRSFDAVQSTTRNFTLPAIILATAASLEAPSISHHILHAIAQQPQSAVIVTHDVEEGTLTHQLLSVAYEAALAQPRPSSLTLRFSYPELQPLEGEELRAFLAQQKIKEEQREMESQTTTAMEEEDDGENEGDDDDTRGAASRRQPQRPAGGGVDGPQLAAALPSQSSSPSPFASSSSSPPFYMFPFVEPKRPLDAFGELGGLPALADVEEAGAHSLLLPHTNGEGGELPDRKKQSHADHSHLLPQQPPPAHGHTPRPTLSSSSAVASRSPPTPARPPAAATSSTAAGAAAAPSAAPSSSSPLSRPPSRVRFVSGSLAVQCRVCVVDFRGLSDGRSVRNILTACKPRKLVLVHGHEQDKAELKHFAIERKLTTQQHSTPTHTTSPQPAAAATQSSPAAHAAIAKAETAGAEGGRDAGKSGSSAAAGSVVAMEDGEPPSSLSSSASSPSVRASPSVFIPSWLEVVDISAEVSFRLALSSQLLPRLRFARVDDYEVAYTEAQVQLDRAQPINTPQLTPVSSQSQQRVSTRSRTTASAAAVQPSHPSVFLGSSKLSDFRQLLSRAGIDSEFVGGAVLLAAHGTVRIRKASPTLITLQGSVSDAFFTIRSLLYSTFQRV